MDLFRPAIVFNMSMVFERDFSIEDEKDKPDSW